MCGGLYLSDGIANGSDDSGCLSIGAGISLGVSLTTVIRWLWVIIAHIPGEIFGGLLIGNLGGLGISYTKWLIDPFMFARTWHTDILPVATTKHWSIFMKFVVMFLTVGLSLNIFGITLIHG